MDVDFLSLLVDETSEPENAASELVVAHGSAAQLQSDAVAACAALVPAQPAFKARSKFPSMRGRVGKGRHGDTMQRSLLTCHMRSVKLQRRVERFSAAVSDICRRVVSSPTMHWSMCGLFVRHKPLGLCCS